MEDEGLVENAARTGEALRAGLVAMPSGTRCSPTCAAAG